MGFRVIEEKFRKELQSTLGLVRDKLPYLESISPHRYPIYRGYLPYDDETPGHIIANADIIAQIGLWQERNQCGRALLLKPVAPTVPAGLWPSILEVASNKISILTGNGPPVEGINYLVHGLVAANLIGGNSSSGEVETSPRSAPHDKGNENRPKRQRTS